MNPAREDDCDAKLLRAAYARQPLALGLSVGVVFVFAGLLWPYFPADHKIPWIAALLGVLASRAALWFAYSRPGGARATAARAWRYLFIAGACAGGAAWSFGPLMMIERAGEPANYLLALTLIAVSAVSMSALVGQLAAMWGFQAAALLPTAWKLAATGGEFERLAALIVGASMLTLMAVGRESHRVARRRIETDEELARLVDEAGRARERAERASLAKSRFLANMSHELRTPLAAVIGAAQLLDAEAGDADSRAELTASIKASGANLLVLIDSILDLSRIEAGELRLVERDFDLLECIESALATSALAARAKGLRVACIVDPALPLWRRGDESRLRQILLNLLGNAVKFTGAGEVVLHATATGGGVRIEVRDTGIGIAADRIAQIFEPFRQADEGTDRRFGGSGLGLAIAAQVAGAMGGRIGVNSDPGRGSRFQLELPLAPAAVAPVGPAPLELQVTYVEPHEASAQALDALLRRLGCTPRRCAGTEALRAWAAERRGKAAAWLLLDADSAELPAWLAVVDDVVDPQHILAMVSGDADAAAAAAQRPHLPRQLMRPITRSALATRLAAPAPLARSQPMPLEPSPGNEPAEPTCVLVVEDDQLNQTIVCRLLEHAGYRVEAAGNGSEALALLRARAFDLVLMDWQMPDMDGIEVTRRVREGDAGEAARGVPIVALTANAFADDRLACLAAGMDDFLTKPIDAERLVRTIEHWSRKPTPRLVPVALPGPAAPRRKGD